MITSESLWRIEYLDQKYRPADLKKALSRGNHKSAKENGYIFNDAIIKEIEKG